MAKFGLFPIADAKAIRNRVLGGHVTEFKEFTQPRGGGGGRTGLALTPSGGIPARSGTTVGVATCSLAELYDDAGTIKIRAKSPTESIEVYNTTSIGIGGSRWIHWKTDGQYKIVDVDDC